MRETLLLLAVAALTSAAAPPSAAPADPPVTAMPTGEAPEVVARWVEHMRSNIDSGTYPDGRPIARETAAERAGPIMSPELAKQIFDRGKLSGEVEACGGDWKMMSLDPMMAELQARKDLTPKQLGFAVMLHNAAQEQTKHRLEEECTPEHKQMVSSALKASMSRKG